MVIVGDVLVTKIIEKVIDVGFSYLADQYTRHAGGMKDELQRLKVALPRIQAVVAAADNALTLEQQTANPHLQAWLQQFKDALYEADDALDELEYLRLQKQVEADDERDNKVRHCFSNSKQSITISNLASTSLNLITISASIQKRGVGDTSLDEPPHKLRRLSLLFHAKEKIMRFVISDPTLEKLRGAVKRLDEVAAHVGDFLALVSSIGQQSQHQPHRSFRVTGSLVTETIVFGRDKEREELLQWLMKGQPVQDEKNNVSIYSVVGHGGMGKTTLAQLVYNDENVQKSFDLKMWVCVSTSFDIKQITAAMLESATKKRPKIDNLPTLQDALKDKLMSSDKFLLVLDDVWDDQKNCSDWDNLLAPLRHGHKGSKILLTTRMDKVAKEAMRAMGGSSKEYLKLNPIHGDDFFSVFNRYAFAGISSGDCKELHPLGKKIAERLGGSPLAAKTIGALLNSYLDERYWISILNCKNISDQGQQHEGNIMSILMLSYNHLPLYLRPCFSLCGSFPQDYEFDKEDLVLKWMALGLIQYSPQNQGQTLEDIGSYYFDELFNRSFFEQKNGYRKCSYIMHDLLHDVARSVSHGECFSIVDDDKSVEDIPNTVRHLYLATNNLNIVLKVDKWQHLRSLQLRINSHVLSEVAEVLEKVIKSLKCVRMLEVCVDGIRVVLPDVFGDLRHLRCLTISSEIDEFPASLCKLHNLQVLKLTIKDSTAALPENMKNLISLRHLVMTSSWYGGRICPVIIARVRRLASLQVLSIFIKKEREYKIDELEGLNMIRELHLDGLENVESPEEASMAKLGNKVHLRVLTLRWRAWDIGDTERNINPTKMDEQQQQIVDCLQPHSSLKELTIEGYKGVRPAKWIDIELVNNLQRISLSDCSRLEHLPNFAKLPFLKYLSLSIPLVKQLDCDCQQLEELHLQGMVGLEELSQSDGNSGQWCPRLRKLVIEYCPKLSVLPSLSSSLQSMKIKYCPSLRLDPTVIDPAGNDENFLPSSLKDLCIEDCGELERSIPTLLKGAHTCLSSLSLGGIKSFPCSSVWRRLASLDWLTISNCKELMSLEVISTLQHLRCLEIENCPKLVCTATTAVATGSTLAVDELVIDDPMLLLKESLIRNLTSLRQLYIWNCYELESISGEMEEWLLQSRTTLNKLNLYGASSLKSLPDSLHTFSSLKVLELFEPGELQSVPRLPSSLQSLNIEGCNQTLKDRCRKDEGADWPNINHIPDIRIYLELRGFDHQCLVSRGLLDDDMARH